MKRIGMIVAVEIEAVLQQYGAALERQQIDGFEVQLLQQEGYQLIIVRTGAGEIAAAAGTQLLISRFGVDFVVNFGVVGGLTPEMALARTCVVERVVHYDMDTSEIDGTLPGQYADYPSVYIPCQERLLALAQEVYPQLQRVTCASGDKFVGDPAKKAALHQQFDAQICEMEAAGILITCNRAKVPCLLIKTVSDSITGGAEEFSAQVDRSAAICLQIAHDIIQRL